MEPVTYELKVPATLQIHNMFNVSLLKPLVQRRRCGAPPVPSRIDVDADVEFEVQSILDSQNVWGKFQYLIAWKGYGPDENSWEPASHVYMPVVHRMFHRLLGKFYTHLLKHPVPQSEDRKKYDREFAVSTSFHGLHKIVGTRTRTSKILWMFVVLGSVFIVSWQIYTRFLNYFSWPTTTSVTVQYVNNIDFPAVTFCNLNRYQTQAVANLSIVFFLWSIVSAVLHFSTVDGNSKFSQEISEFLQGNQNFSIKEFTRNYGFYLNNSTLLKCEYFGKPCYPKDFEHVFTEYGNCFTFNHNSFDRRRKVSVSGRGLSLLFNIKQSEFTDDPALGFVDAGITFVIHSPEKPPQFDGLGLWTPVGMHAHASIRQLKTVIQEYPWGECNPNIKLKYSTIYSTYGCVQECKARHIQNQCGCLPFLLPGNGMECDLEKFYNCVSPALYNIEILGVCSVGTHNTTCPVPCEETEYPATISYSTFASEKAVKFLSMKLRKSSEYIRKNLVYIDIKYHDLNYKMTQQQKALSSTELLADVGGQLGLFCGASVITVIEVLEYVVTNFYWMCIFLLLKLVEVPQCTPAAPNQLKTVQQC
ncbi:bile acid-sensitive ion channel [Microcaecilia unicolor]|uniref:Acid-sensing ion channel 5 n=1 Tax=Microcaecilia unicolor TaxID=1415580 RepID=A0A6P7XBX9_9AMPH|nr:acid-sensing ion channel 5 [Microcaecilia unicolor]